MTPEGKGGLWLPGKNVDGPNLLRHLSGGKVTTVYLPGSKGWPTIANAVSRIPGTTEVLVGGETVNETTAGTNHAVVFQYS